LSELALIHIPTPGDHYSPATGSAIISVVYELGKQHLLNGGTHKIVVGRNTQHDYDTGECLEVDFPPRPSRNLRGVDAILARVGLPRYFMRRVHSAVDGVLKPDFDGCVMVHNAPVGLAAVKRAAPNSRVCLYAHNDLFSSYSRSEMRRSLEPAYRIICVSQYIADLITRQLGEADPRLRVVHNGVNTSVFKPAGRSLAADSPPTILFIGRVVREKGVDLLLRAAATLGDRKFILRIVGSDNFNSKASLSSYEEELRRLAEPIQDRVEFIPFVDRSHVVSLYESGTIYCAPSNWDDPCPLTVLEALAMGLPIVTSRRGGIPEEGKDAVRYFSPPAIEELAAHLAELIDGPALRDELGLKARARAEELSWQSQYQALVRALA